MCQDEIAARILYPLTKRGPGPALSEVEGSRRFCETRDFGTRGNLQIRIAIQVDSEAITTLINATFSKAEAFFIDGDRITLQAVQSLMEKGKFLLAHDQGTITGCVYVELRGERAYLGLLSVDPEHQRAGLGTVLMNAAEKYCAESGCRFMDLQIVNLRTELPAFYRKRGYLETGTAPFPREFSPKLSCHFVKWSKALT